MYFATAWGVSILGVPNNFSLPIYPAAGVALGGCICCGIRLWSIEDVVKLVDSN